MWKILMLCSKNKNIKEITKPEITKQYLIEFKAISKIYIV